MKDRNVLAQAIVKGAGTTDFFGTAYGEHDGKYDGFKFGDANVQFDDTLLLIEPNSARAYDVANQPAPAIPTTTQVAAENPDYKTPPVAAGAAPPTQPSATSSSTNASPKAKSFHGSADVSAATAKMRLVQIAEEMISLLISDPNATVKVRLEIDAEFSDGAADQIKRAISENAKTLGFGTAEWE